MDRIKKKNNLEICEESVIFKELAEEISRKPFQWVLVLGEDISCQKKEIRDKIIVDQAGEALKKENYFKKKEIFRAAESRDFESMKDILFGNIWDGASFLDARRKMQADFRKSYAEKLAKKDQINTECQTECLELYLKIFPGIILTTCQDETIEAFMEEESSMVSDGLICTPYTLMTSPRWQKWKKVICKEEEASVTDIAVGTIVDNPRILIKLSGDCKKEHRMLLSKQDFAMYYPEENRKDGKQETEGFSMTDFLTELFANKNLFFLGMQPSLTEEKSLPLPFGILKCLKDSISDKKRYAFLTHNGKEEQEKACWEKYGVTAVSGASCNLEKDFYEKLLCQEKQDYNFQTVERENKIPDVLILGHDKSAKQLAEIIKKYLDTGKESGRYQKTYINIYGPLGTGKIALENSSLELLRWKNPALYETAIGRRIERFQIPESGDIPKDICDRLKSLSEGSILMMNVIEKSKWEEIEEIIRDKKICAVVKSRERLKGNFDFIALDFLPKKHSDTKEAGVLTVEELFQKLYIRRPYSSIADREKKILKEQIIQWEKTKEDGRTRCLEWNGSGVYVLAMIANNLADFYDLQCAFEAAQREVCQNAADIRNDHLFCERILWKMMNERLNEKSKALYRILSFYGSGFPVEFLQLMEGKIEKWKRAGVQLANSGICIQHGNRKDIYRKIDFADHIIKSAGEDFNGAKIDTILQEVKHSLGNSYFYLSEVVNRRIKNDPEYDIEKIKVLFKNVFQKMSQILMEKSRGYYELRPFLVTEMPVIIEKMKELEDEHLEWKPELIYCLLRENAVTLQRNNTDLDDCMEQLLHRLNEKINNSNKCEGNVWRYKKVMILQAWSIMESQLYQQEKQREALKKCEEALEELMKYGGVKEGADEEKWKNMPEEYFRQLLQVYFQKIRIYGKSATIEEIKRFKTDKKGGEKQLHNLIEMYKHLKFAKKLLKEREALRGGCYQEEHAELNSLWGEYYFKMSQYKSENRRLKQPGTEMSKAEKKPYVLAEYYDKLALKYYNKYPGKYEVQRGNIMRSMGDLYCQRAKEDKRKRKLKEKSYDMLADAYALYRKNNDLHGIANILQSRGNLEEFESQPYQGRRSPFAFYSIAKSIYEYLGDDWSYYVAVQFYIGGMEACLKYCREEKRKKRLLLHKEILELEQKRIIPQN